jgi:drug/metabolite transporter (DMT)-like permease
MENKSKSIFYAFVAACLFGASAPLAKLLLNDIQPVVLASLLYLGSGFGLLIYKLFAGIAQKKSTQEARLSRTDLPWLLGATVSGGIAAPIVLMFSLRHTPAATASLLLNFEGVVTALIAAAAFREAISRRIWAAITCITVAIVLLSLDTSGKWGVSPGALGVLCACALWGVDNNFTRNISAKDPVVIVIVKGIAAGLVSLILALILGNTFPGGMKTALPPRIRHGAHQRILRFRPVHGRRAVVHHFPGSAQCAVRHLPAVCHDRRIFVVRRETLASAHPR